MMLSALADVAFAPSRHLHALLHFARGAGIPITLTCIGGSASDFQRLELMVVESGCCVTVQQVTAPPHLSSYHLFLPGELTDSHLILEALMAGICVIPAEAQLWREAEWEDFEAGWLKNPAADFFASFSPHPVHVGCPARLDLGLGATINPRAIILNALAGPGGEGSWVRVGRASHLGADCLLNLGPTPFLVGKFSMISANFSAHAMRHTLSHISNFCIQKGPFAFFGSLNDQVAPIVVGNDVWIGERVTVLPGVEFADGSVVGAGSVVTHSTEPYGVYAGNPARLIRYRFAAEKIELLCAAAWWDFSFASLVEIQQCFRRPVDELSVEELRGLL